MDPVPLVDYGAVREQHYLGSTILGRTLNREEPEYRVLANLKTQEQVPDTVRVNLHLVTLNPWLKFVMPYMPDGTPFHDVVVPRLWSGTQLIPPGNGFANLPSDDLDLGDGFRLMSASVGRMRDYNFTRSHIMAQLSSPWGGDGKKTGLMDYTLTSQIDYTLTSPNPKDNRTGQLRFSYLESVGQTKEPHKPKQCEDELTVDSGDNLGGQVTLTLIDRPDTEHPDSLDELTVRFDKGGKLTGASGISRTPYANRWCSVPGSVDAMKKGTGISFSYPADAEEARILAHAAFDPVLDSQTTWRGSRNANFRMGVRETIRNIMEQATKGEDPELRYALVPIP